MSFERKAYQGGADIEVILHKLPSGHWYEAIRSKTRERIKWCNSVTRYTKHVISKQLFDWAVEKGKAEAERIKVEGGMRGTAVHRAQERLAAGMSVPLKDYSREVAEHIVAYKNWYDDIDPQFVETEEIVYDPASLEGDGPGVAGTLDLRYVLTAAACEKLKIDKKHIREEIDGIHVVNDLKTGKGLYEEDAIQVNAYAHMRNDIGIDPDVGVPVEWISLLRTNSRHKRGYEFVIEPLSEARKKAFDCLKVYVDHVDPQLEPYFPKPLPEVIQLYSEDPVNGRK
jgi:hypothetical protein